MFDAFKDILIPPGSGPCLGGMPVVLSEHLEDPDRSYLHQFRFTSSNKRRVKKKWFNNKKNWKRVKGEVKVYTINGQLVMHPNTWKHVEKQIG